MLNFSTVHLFIARHIPEINEESIDAQTRQTVYGRSIRRPIAHLYPEDERELIDPVLRTRKRVGDFHLFPLSARELGSG